MEISNQAPGYYVLGLNLQRLICLKEDFSEQFEGQYEYILVWFDSVSNVNVYIRGYSITT